jgi:hypothetical protein
MNGGAEQISDCLAVRRRKESNHSLTPLSKRPENKGVIFVFLF